MQTQRKSQDVLLLGASLRYEPESGHFLWTSHPTMPAKNGARADIQGSFGYRIVCFKGKQYKAHRLAFLLVTGAMPDLVDHKNCIRADNRWANLRPADYQLNAQNRGLVRNPTQLMGVTKRGRKYQARIRAMGRNWYLGDYDSPEAAHAAYMEVKKVAHPGALP